MFNSPKPYIGPPWGWKEPKQADKGYTKKKKAAWNFEML